MIIVAKGAGEKISYSIDGNRVDFDDDLAINLAKRERDWAVHIDICRNADGELVIGAAAGRSYVAQIDIPARKYTESVEDIDGEEQTIRTPAPLDMETVTLSLWPEEV